MAKKRVLILYELNEVPWPLLDAYIQRNPDTALEKLLTQGSCWTTVTQDSGELHPWSTWPTLHRGVYNDVHNITFLNQKITSDFPPLWELTAKAGLTTGVFGSLQSWPVKQEGNYSFYIPDTFAQDSQTYPKAYEVFQDFNLAQTKRDGAYARPFKITLSDMEKGISLFQKGLTLSTLLKVGIHVLQERLNPDYRTFRAILQAPLSFDFFWKLLHSTRPQFSTFFTNHCASMMHRYWKHYFQEDLTTKRDLFLSRNVHRALKIADQQIARLMTYCDTHDGVLVVASSMGQEAVNRGTYYPELRIVDSEKFVRGLGFQGSYEANLAMQPDFPFSFSSCEDRDDFVDRVRRLRDGSGRPLFGFKIAHTTVNLSLGVPQGQGILLQNQRQKSFEEMGFEVVKRDEGTAYHIPSGIAVFYGASVAPQSRRETIESIQLAPTILDYLGLTPEEYMCPSLLKKIFTPA